MSEAFSPVDNVRVAYTEVGEGSPLVMVHGSGLSRAMWRGLGYVKALRDDYRLILVDLRGHGLSDKPHRPDDYRMELVVADLLAVLDAAGVTSAHYFGYSFGARAGFTLAATHPERLLSFVSAAGSYRAPGRSVGKLFFEGYDDALGVGGMRAFIDGWEERRGMPVDPATTAAFLANDPVAIRSYFQRVELEPGVDEQALYSIETPTLLLAGTDDRRAFSDSERAAELMPQARFVPLPGRDHASTLRPAAGVIEVVREFLASAAPQPPEDRNDGLTQL
ncbi:alpha/beta hydrolase [Subtercola sp. PAMC28395]|uniref:alpha/beta fold hydrolase n=1 Tax=Subtercola sp. PAMC28395 TaxID=2846775 RepID=UPI001C0E03A2|nr:alpha/beta hydrolase [Subtercola sp. PAMC28395]QWT24653.1 alpha/beta hydrolase [Subtercola sp. PAMC28395]